MKIKLVLYHVFHEIDPSNFPEKVEFLCNYDELTTFEQLFEKIDYPLTDLSEYYKLSGSFSFNERYLPYIINSEGKIEWDIPYSDAKIKDFLNTHEIKDDTIVGKVGYPQCGGPGFKNLFEIWTAIYPIIDQFVTILTLGTFMFGAGKWLKSKLKKKDVPPQSYFDVIYSRKMWNNVELSKLIGISEKDAKKLLQIFGYEYNNSSHIYVQQPRSLELREKLSKINVHDI